MRFEILSVACVAAAACVPGIRNVGKGGSGGVDGSTTVMASATGTTVAATTTGVKSATVTSSSSGMTSVSTATVGSTSTGVMPPPELQLYRHPYPFSMGSSWLKSPISAVLGSGAPTQGIVSAVKLQNLDALYLLTNDNNMHVLHANAWTITAVDTLFQVPTSGCVRNDVCMAGSAANTIPCVNVGSEAIPFIYHIPGPACTTGTPSEGIALVGPTLGTSFNVNPTTFGGIFQDQRDYHAPCNNQPFGSSVYALWGFDVAWAPDCGTAGWFQWFAWYNDGKLRNYGGPNAGPWTAADPNNPIFKTPAEPNQPDPNSVVGAYFEQGAVKYQGTVVLIAP